MPSHVSKGVVWGIAAGAAVLLVVMGAITIILWRRMRQKKIIARTLAAGERRLSGYPGGHFSITDADVARMPGTKRVLCRTPGSYGSTRGYTAVTSRESLPRRPVVAKTSINRNPVRVENTTFSPSWPLPRRLTRSNATPLVKIKSSSLTPITEKSTQRVQGNNPVWTNKPLPMTDQAKDKVKFHLPVPNPQGSLHSDIFVTPIAKPEPLFHAKLRSSSAGAIPQLLKPQPDLAVPDSAGPSSRVPRSSSLCSQQSGLVPNIPIPPLPLNLPPSKRFHSIKSPTESSSRRTSGNSLFSGDTYILDDSVSRPFSQAETDFTSTSLASTSNFGYKPEGLGIFIPEDISWDPSSFRQSPKISQPAKTTKVTVPGPQVPLRASVVNSLPRSESSGLSMSLLDHGPSRTTSSVSLTRSKSTLRVPGNLDRNARSLREVSPISPLRKIAAYNSNQDVKNKRLSTSVLQVVSGNNGIPLHDRLEKRPSSWSTGNPFDWQPTSMQPGNPSAMKARTKGHVSQNSVRISTVQPLRSLTPVKYSHAPTPSDVAPRIASSILPCLDLSKNDYFLPRPPTRVTLEPQISNSKRVSQNQGSPNHQGSSNQNNSNTCSPALSLVGLYSSGTAKSSHESSTPEKIPTQELRSGANPNRHKTVFSQNPSRWSFLDSEPPLTPSSKTPPPPHTPNSPSPSSPFPSPSPSFLFPMPPNSYPSKRLSTPPRSPLRGPRALPPHHRSSRRVSKSLNAPAPYGRDLRKSIMAIRRMNSEAGDLNPRQRSRYLSIGRPGSNLLDGRGARNVFEEMGRLEENQGVRGARVRGARGRAHVSDRGLGDGAMTPSPGPGRAGLATPDRSPAGGGGGWNESPGRLYDEDGFLRE